MSAAKGNKIWQDSRNFTKINTQYRPNKELTKISPPNMDPTKHSQRLALPKT